MSLPQIAVAGSSLRPPCFLSVMCSATLLDRVGGFAYRLSGHYRAGISDLDLHEKVSESNRGVKGRVVGYLDSVVGRLYRPRSLAPCPLCV